MHLAAPVPLNAVHEQPRLPLTTQHAPDPITSYHTPPPHRSPQDGSVLDNNYAQDRAAGPKINFKLRSAAMGLGFFGIFMAFNTAQSLASTLGSTTIPGLGDVCLAVLYGGTCL